MNRVRAKTNDLHDIHTTVKVIYAEVVYNVKMVIKWQLRVSENPTYGSKNQLHWRQETEWVVRVNMTRE